MDFPQSKNIYRIFEGLSIFEEISIKLLERWFPGHLVKFFKITLFKTTSGEVLTKAVLKDVTKY